MSLAPSGRRGTSNFCYPQSTSRSGLGSAGPLLAFGADWLPGKLHRRIVYQPNPDQPEPHGPRIDSITQHVAYGKLPTSIKAPVAYTGNPNISVAVLGRLRHLMVNAVLAPCPELLDDWNAGLMKSSSGGAPSRIDDFCTPRSFVESVERYKRIRSEGPEVDDPELLAEIQPLLDDDPEYAAERAAALADPGFAALALRTPADVQSLRWTLEIRRRERRHAQNPFSSEALEWRLNRVEESEGMN